MINVSAGNTRQFNYVAQFSCIADKCPDTCCAGWMVRIEEPIQTLYSEKAPELLKYVLLDETGAKMKLNGGTCSQLTNGLCHIHKTYGEDYLSDTCSFYPRKVTQVGQTRLMSAESSCPEIARIILTDKSPFSLVSKSIDRIPNDVTDGFVDDEREKNALITMQRFIAETEREDLTAEEIMSRIIVAGEKLDHINKQDWAKTLNDVFANVSLPSSTTDNPSEISHADLISHVTLLCINGSAKWHSLLKQVKQWLQANDLITGENKSSRFRTIVAAQKESLATYTIDHALKRFIGSELIRRVFPYGNEKGRESGMVERIMPIALFFCVFRTALLAHNDQNAAPLSVESIVTIFQTISREINHLLTPVSAYFSAKGLADMNVLLQLVNNTDRANPTQH